MDKNYIEKLKNDKVFLLSMIDDPLRTFRAYGYHSDEILIGMLTKVSNDVLNRAREAFMTLGKDSIDNSCNACEGCDACEGCEGCDACGDFE